MGKFFHAILSGLKKAWEKVEGVEPGAEHAAVVTISVVSPLLDTILIPLAGTENEQKVQGVIDTVKADLGVAQTIINGAEVEGGPTLDSVFSDVKNNIGSILEIAQVKDTTTVQTIESITSTVIGEIEAIESAFATQKTAAASTGNEGEAQA